MTTALTAIITALVTVGIIGIFKSRHLFVVLPKLHLYSPLTTGSTVNITIVNGGFRSEEAVTLHLNPAARYEVMAASRPDVTLNNATLVVPRLGRFKRATIILLVEGKAFGRDDLLSVESKETIGRVVEKAENASTIFEQFVGASLLLLFIGASFLYGTWIGAETKTNFVSYFADEYVRDSVTIEPKEVSWVDLANLKASKFVAQNGGKMPVSVKQLTRRGNTVYVDFEFENASSAYFMMNVTVKSAADEDGAIGFRDSRFYDFLVPPGEKKQRRLQAYVPPAAKTRVIFIDYSLQLTDTGKRYFFSQNLQLP